MKTYLVGGAVRDKLLGLPVTERDWVVVGATPAEMLAQGFRQVGKEFPVFLHPKTNEEYALARMERKINLGYKGFEVDASPSVSLEEDLLRRDLTINAMAETLAGELIDPYHGKKDLEQRLLKHVSPAFAEDPVRILRVARFLARYTYLGFKVAPETLTLMQSMVKAGEVNALVAERVWKELERALSEKNPEAFFSTLNDCHALTILFPDLLTHQKFLAALIQISHSSCESDVRFAALFYMANEKIVSDLAKRYRIPNAYKELALLTVRETMTAIKAQTLSTEELLAFFNRLDIFRREDRFIKFLQVVSAIATILDSPFNSSWLQSAAQAVKDIDVQSLLEQGLQGNDLAIAIKTQRLNRLNEWIRNQ